MKRILSFALAAMVLAGCRNRAADDDLLIFEAPDNFLNDEEIEMKYRATDLYMECLEVDGNHFVLNADAESFEERGIPAKYYEFFRKQTEEQNAGIDRFDAEILENMDLAENLLTGKEEYFAKRKQEPPKNDLFSYAAPEDTVAETMTAEEYMKNLFRNYERLVLNPQIELLSYEYAGIASDCNLHDMVKANLDAPVFRVFNAGDNTEPELMYDEMVHKFSRERLSAVEKELCSEIINPSAIIYRIEFGYVDEVHNYHIFFNPGSYGRPVLKYNIFGGIF